MMTPSPALRAIASEDGAAILDIQHDLISTLNPTGAYVWQRLRRGESIEAITMSLAHDTGENPLTIESDVHDFIHELRQKQLLPR